MERVRALLTPVVWPAIEDINVLERPATCPAIVEFRALEALASELEKDAALEAMVPVRLLLTPMMATRALLEFAAKALLRLVP